MKMNYPEYFQYFKPDSVLVLSDTYDSFFQNLDTDLESNLFVPSFSEFSALYLDFKTKQDTASTDTPLIIRKMEHVSQLFNEVKVKNFIYHQLFSSTIDQSINDASLIIDNYRKLQTNPVYLEEDINTYNSWSHLTKGESA
ncbi:MAG: hypothetical protein IPO92_15770 [Saprospiraceae bacterium]|nr:hypothetical protein [Saprospiraceae bacterium]